MSYDHTYRGDGSDKTDPYYEKGHSEVYPTVNDVEEHVQPKEEETHRSLKPRQISMIAIGGAIGTWIIRRS